MGTTELWKLYEHAPGAGAVGFRSKLRYPQLFGRGITYGQVSPSETCEKTAV